jgi:hypothetical protein
MPKKLNGSWCLAFKIMRKPSWVTLAADCSGNLFLAMGLAADLAATFAVFFTATPVVFAKMPLPKFHCKINCDYLALFAC